MIEIKKYAVENCNQWNEFNKNSKNGYFMFDRNFMEYHSDRFTDSSLMFFEDDILLAIFPANIAGDVLYSHQGLSFGGFLINQRMSTAKMLDLFKAIRSYCRDHNITKVIYKCIPAIYHSLPAGEDLYCLFLNDAKVLKKEPSSVIYLQNPLKFAKGKKCGISKAKKANLTIGESTDFEKFFCIETDVLKRYNAKPVHTFREMELLYSRFPENIRLYGVFNLNKEMIAGSILFITDMVVHTQYMASTEEGRENGALDYLMSYLIFEKYADKRFFDFGISSENNGKILNEGLISQKEMMGGRTVVFETYELNIQ